MPMVEMSAGDSLHFLGLKPMLDAQLIISRIVQQAALLDDVAEKVMDLPEAFLDKFYIMDDDPCAC